MRRALSRRPVYPVEDYEEILADGPDAPPVNNWSETSPKFLPALVVVAVLATVAACGIGHAVTSSWVWPENMERVE